MLATHIYLTNREQHRCNLEHVGASAANRPRRYHAVSAALSPVSCVWDIHALFSCGVCCSTLDQEQHGLTLRPLLAHRSRLRIAGCPGHAGSVRRCAYRLAQESPLDAGCSDPVVGSAPRRPSCLGALSALRPECHVLPTLRVRRLFLPVAGALHSGLGLLPLFVAEAALRVPTIQCRYSYRLWCICVDDACGLTAPIHIRKAI